MSSASRRSVRVGLLSIVVGLAATFGGCGDSQTGGGDTTGTDAGPSTNGTDGSAPAIDAGQPIDAGVSVDGGQKCDPSLPAWCKAYDVVTSCDPQKGWVDTTCPSGCYAGKCSTTACADECNVGDKSALGTCQLWDPTKKAVATQDATTSTSDRARGYDSWLRAHNMPEGAVAYAVYTDATRTTVSQYTDIGDSSIFTGSALAAEAFRLHATGSADANARVDAMVKTLHDWANVSGDTGYLARFAHLHGSTAPMGETLCTNPDMHCNVTYAGQSWDWLGVTSRDQYTGVMLGFHLAYLASSNEATRALIRHDVVTIAKELAKTRTNLPVHVVIDGVPIDKNVTISNVILAPSEMQNGKVTINVSTSNASGATLVGMRDFLPDYATLVGQVIPLGGVPIPRASSAMMIGAFFRMAMEMTKGVPGSEADYTALSTYYAANFDSWIGIANQWSFSANCGSGYFANHITYIMAYVWAALEDDPVRGPKVRDGMFDGKMWSALSGQKQAYFAYLWAATRAAVPTTEVNAANAQLAAFQPAPRVHAPVDVLAKYTHDAKCTENGFPSADTGGSVATDIADRCVADFLWQRDPWCLKDLGDQTVVYPGVDYLVAYWAARANGLLADDHAGTCARWIP